MVVIKSLCYTCTVIFFKNGACYIPVDPKTYINQKGIWSNKLFLHTKTNIIQNMKQNISFCFTFIFYRIAIVKQDPNMAHLLSKAISVLWRTHFRIHRYVAASLKNTICIKQWTIKIQIDRSAKIWSMKMKRSIFPFTSCELPIILKKNFPLHFLFSFLWSFWRTLTLKSRVLLLTWQLRYNFILSLIHIVYSL